MNTTLNTTEKDNSQSVFNYAQAAQTSSQNVESQTSNNDNGPISELEPAEAKNATVEASSSEIVSSIDAQANESNPEPLTSNDSANLVEESSIETVSNQSDGTESNKESQSKVNESVPSMDNVSTSPEPNNSSSQEMPAGYKNPTSPNGTGNWQGNQYYGQFYGRNTYPTFVPQPSVNKAIPIINPDTSEVINLSSSSLKTDENKEIKAVSPSRAVKIVNPQEKEEVEQNEKEEDKSKESEKTVEEGENSKTMEETNDKPEPETEDSEFKNDDKSKDEPTIEDEERIAAITADKIARGVAPGRLDISAIPAHVFHDSPVTSPSSNTPPKVKRAPLPVIEDFSAIQYPSEIIAPKGKDPVSGRIVYERAFLIQFQKLCTETDEDLSQLPSATEEAGSNENRRSMSRRQTSERGRGPRTPGGSGDSMSRNNSRDSRGEMGKFSSGRSFSHRQGSSGPNSPGMERQGSQGGRSRSSRGGKNRHNPKEQSGGPTIPPEQVVPLAKSENRWVPAVIKTGGAASTTSEAIVAEVEAELIPQEMIARKVKALLNKLTIEKFDSISDQIWEYAKQSEKEDNGQSLRNVIQLVFDKACDEPNFASMWAQLCRKMYDVISQNTEIKDVNILDKNGEPVSSGSLYRKYLLNRCQQEFEKGWKSNLPKMDENSASEMLTDEYYAAVKAKRQGLGLVQFVGELYKRQMLSDRVMIECLMRLCSDPQQPEDDETETMCKLMTTIGQTFESSSRKNKEWLDTYFERMKEMYKSSTLSSRIKFKILDVFDLRKSKWTLKRGNQPAPTTLAEIHEQAKKANEEKESMKRSSSSRGTASHPVSRQGSYRGGSRPL